MSVYSESDALSSIAFFRKTKQPYSVHRRQEPRVVRVFLVTCLTPRSTAQTAMSRLFRSALGCLISCRNLDQTDRGYRSCDLTRRGNTRLINLASKLFPEASRATHCVRSRRRRWSTYRDGQHESLHRRAPDTAHLQNLRPETRDTQGMSLKTGVNQWVPG